MPTPRKSAITIAVLCLFAAAPVNAQEIQWRHDYETARREAREKNRPLLIDFGTANCSWCTKLDGSTFRDPAMVKQVNEQFVALRIDADANRRLTNDLQIKSFPTLVFAAPDGRIIGVQEGFVEAAKLSQQLRRAVADAVAQSPAPSPPSIAKVEVQQAPPVSPPAVAVRITAPPLEGAEPTDRIYQTPELGASVKIDAAKVRKTAEQLAEQLGELHLCLAESALNQNQPQQAVAHLERVLQVCPGLAFAQAARRQLDLLQSPVGGVPPMPVIRAQSK